MVKDRLEEKINKKEKPFFDRQETKKAVNYGLMISTALTILLPGGGSAWLIKNIACKTMKGLAVTHAYQHRKEIGKYLKKMRDGFDNYGKK